MKNLNLLKKNARLLVIGCVICSNIIAGQATEKPECDRVLSACLDYAKTLEVERDFLAAAVKRQHETIKDLEGKQSSQPWYFWVLMGAAGGIVLTGVK